MRRRLPIGPGQARLSIATGAAALAALSSPLTGWRIFVRAVVLVELDHD